MPEEEEEEEDDMQKFVPSSTTSRRFCHLPKWVNQDLRHKINCHRTLVKKFHSNPTPSLSQKVCLSKERLDHDVKVSKSMYITQLVDDKSKGCKSDLFRHLRVLTKSDQIPPCVSLNTSSAESDEGKVTLFNLYFHSVYSTASTCCTTPGHVSHLVSMRLTFLLMIHSRYSHAWIQIRLVALMALDRVS